MTASRKICALYHEDHGRWVLHNKQALANAGLALAALCARAEDMREVAPNEKLLATFAHHLFVALAAVEEALE